MISGTSYKTTATEYLEGVLSGDIPACRLARAACERHRYDLTRQNTDDFPYYFDEKEAQDVCQFFPLALKHSKGRWAGLPFELSNWQVFITWVLFGWKRADDNYRRFRRAYLSYARKNGKSTQAAGYGLYALTCDGEPGAEVYVSATKREQAACVFTEAERMRRSSAALSKVSKNHVNNIFVPATDSFFKPTSSDRPLDGPNPHFVIFDELHAWKEVHRKFYDTMVTGGASRTQPLQITITTAGDDKSLIWLEEYKYCKGVLTGDIDDNSTFAFIAEIDDEDDPLDPTCWVKANPNLGISVSEEYLHEQAKDAKNKPTFYPVFVSKHCNKITSSKDAAFDMPLWDACGGDLDDWSTAEAVGAGVDLGGHDDLAAYALVARWPYDEITDEEGNTRTVYRFECQVRAYIASTTQRDLSKQPFAGFIHDGLIEVCEHPSTQLHTDLMQDCNHYGVRQVAFDRYNAQHHGELVDAAGLQSIAFTQSYSHFNEPIEQLHQAIKDGRFRHDGNPLLRWCASNAVLVKNKQDLWMFDKAASGEKIDPIVAMTMAFKRSIHATARPTGSLYL